jgi:RNA ligase
LSPHIAHQMSFDELLAGLREARAQRLVYERGGPTGLAQFIYTDRCVYEGAWTPITMAARGLILDTSARAIVGTPFPKFFNLGERGEQVPDLPFETMEKLDGSLIIIFHHDGRWHTATKGAFDSSQAQWARNFLKRHDLGALKPGTTYLAEAIYPENKIVVRYDESGLVLLAAYDEHGVEIPYAAVEAVGTALGWRTLRRYAFTSISDLLTHAETLPRTEEGFVIRFENGHRLKIKGNEYRRIHALISRVTPLALWEAMAAGDDLETIRRELPEEFWNDFDAIRSLLGASRDALLEKTARVAGTVKELSDKDIGLRLSSFDDDVRSFIFPYRKTGGDPMSSDRFRASLFRALRPTGNVLSGYVPSYAMTRMMEESN